MFIVNQTQRSVTIIIKHHTKIHQKHQKATNNKKLPESQVPQKGKHKTALCPQNQPVSDQYSISILPTQT